jgi:hypothetical protein
MLKRSIVAFAERSAIFRPDAPALSGPWIFKDSSLSDDIVTQCMINGHKSGLGVPDGPRIIRPQLECNHDVSSDAVSLPRRLSPSTIPSSRFFEHLCSQHSCHYFPSRQSVNALLAGSLQFHVRNSGICFQIDRCLVAWLPVSMEYILELLVADPGPS